MTHRGKEARFNEHMSTNTAVYQHIDVVKGHDYGREDMEGSEDKKLEKELRIRRNRHYFKLENMEILEVCCDDNKLRFLESLYINAYGLKGCLMNKRTERQNRSIFRLPEEESKKVKKKLNPFNKKN